MQKCLKDVGICWDAFYRFCDLKRENQESYARARNIQARKYADDLIELADRENLPSDQKRIMVDTRKWIAANLTKEYRERKEVEVTGELKTYTIIADESKI